MKISYFPHQLSYFISRENNLLLSGNHSDKLLWLFKAA